MQCFINIKSSQHFHKSNGVWAVFRTYEFQGPQSTNNDVFDEDALKNTFDYYQNYPKTRRSILLWRECVERASSKGISKITSLLVQTVKASLSV